eukprot:scaffold280945_cov32-Tisochrysis_lutea.AAC.1
MGREVDPPRERRRTDENKNCLLQEEPLHELSITVVKSSVVNTDAEGQHMAECWVMHAGEEWFEFRRWHAQELRLALIGRAVGDQVKCRQACLTSTRDEDEGWLAGGMDGDGAVGRLVHRCHARAVVLPWEAGDVHLKRDRANRGLEVEERIVRNAEPVA